MKTRLAIAALAILPVLFFMQNCGSKAASSLAASALTGGSLSGSAATQSVLQGACNIPGNIMCIEYYGPAMNTSLTASQCPAIANGASFSSGKTCKSIYAYNTSCDITGTNSSGRVGTINFYAVTNAGQLSTIQGGCVGSNVHFSTTFQ